MRVKRWDAQPQLLFLRTHLRCSTVLTQPQHASTTWQARCPTRRSSWRSKSSASDSAAGARSGRCVQNPLRAYLHVSKPSWGDENMDGVHLEAYVRATKVPGKGGGRRLHCESGCPREQGSPDDQLASRSSRRSTPGPKPPGPTGRCGRHLASWSKDCTVVESRFSSRYPPTCRKTSDIEIFSCCSGAISCRTSTPRSRPSSARDGGWPLEHRRVRR